MNLFKNFIKKCAVLCSLLMIAGLHALHKPNPQPMTPKLYQKMKPQAHKAFENIRSIEAAKVEAETQTLKAQRLKQCYDLMMIMDTQKQEDNANRRQAINYRFFLALFEKNFPIMVSHNIVSNLCFKIMSSPSLSTEESVFITEHGQLAGSIKLNDENWLCYDHPAAEVMLFVPKSYIAQLSTNKDNDIQMKDCGFETKDLIQINNLSPENIINYISKEKKQETTITNAIESIFHIPNKPNTPTWNIFLTGHGSTGGSIAGLKAEDFLKILKVFQKINCSYLHYNSCYAAGINQKIVKNELSQLNVNFIVSTQGSNEEPTSLTQQVISLKSDPNAEYFLYTGQKEHTNFFSMTESFFGSPATFIQKKDRSEAWQKDPIALIVNTVVDKEYLLNNQPLVYIPAVGIFNAFTVDKSVKIITKSIAKAYAFEDKTIEFTDPATKAIVIYPNYVDVPLQIGNATVISPTSSTQEYKPAASPDQLTSIDIYPQFNLTRTLVDPIEHKKVSSLTFSLPQANSENEIYKIPKTDVHIFENMTCYSKLSSLIPQFVFCNKKLDSTIFAIKKLRCWDYYNSNLTNKDYGYVSIENMIIFTQLLPIENQSIIWQTVALFNFNQKTYALTGIFKKSEDSNTSKKTLFKLFAHSPAQEIPNNMKYEKTIWNAEKFIQNALFNERFISKTEHKSDLAGIISLLESRIDKRTQVKGQISLRDVLLEKQANPTQQLPLKARQSWIDYFKDRFYSMIYGQR